MATARSTSTSPHWAPTPNHKDIFVEMDYMPGLLPSEEGARPHH